MIVGKIDSLWRFPVKSFRGEKIDQSIFSKYGVLGDRAYALIDTETGKVVSAKSVKLYPDLLFCSAVYIREPKAGEALPPVLIRLPDGSTVLSDSANRDEVLSAYFKRALTLAQTAPDDFTIDQFHPDIEQLDPAGHRNQFTEEKLGGALFKKMGIDSPLAPGSFLDASPVSIISTSTLDRLQQLQPETNFAVSRFRMNILIKTIETGFVENPWVGKGLAIGNSVRLMVTMPDPRCAMTTLAQDGIPKDIMVLKTLVEHNSLDIMGGGNFPCAGVYAIVADAGMVCINDKVELF